MEGSGAQYSWLVPHDPAGLFASMGGRAAALARLDRFFTELNAGPRSEYAFLSNEPNLGTPWLYDWLGRPDRTQAVVRRALLELYGPGPDGLEGNDDGGTMGAWWVFGALGIYPAVPGTDVLALGSPLFPHVTIRLPRGTLRIDGAGAAPGRPYVRALALDGRAWRRPWLRYREPGGRRAAALPSSGPTPTRWGSAPSQAPPSYSPVVAHHHGGPAATRVARAGELAGRRVARDRLDTAEEQVSLGPAAHRPAALLQPVAAPRGRCPGSASSSRPSTWTRGAATASSARAPPSTTASTVWRIAERMRLEPAEPSASSGRPSRRTTVGAIMLGTLRAGRVAVEAERVQVLLAEHVVEVHARAGHHHARARAVRAGDRGAGAVGVHHRHVGGAPQPGAHLGGHRVERLLRQEALQVAVAAEALEEVGVAGAVGGRDHLGDHRGAVRALEPLEDPERVGHEDAAGRGRRVGEHLAAAVRHAGRLALDHLVAREVLAGQEPAALEHPVADGGGHVALVEEAGALGAQALQEVAQLGEPDRVPGLEEPPSGRVDRLALRGGAEDRLQHAEQEGLHRQHLDP